LKIIKAVMVFNMKKYLTNPIVILIITLVISWSTWITNSAYSNKNLINEYNQHIMTCEKNNKDIILD
jgi:cell division protein FtsL